MAKKFNPKVADLARQIIGEFILERRNEIGYTQNNVASIADVRQATVNDVEHGQNYQINTLIAILTALRGEIKIEWKDTDNLPHFGKTPGN